MLHHCSVCSAHALPSSTRAAAACSSTIDTADPGGIHETLVEHATLVNLARRQRPSALFSESRPGSSRTGSVKYTLDDHRDQHIDHFDDEFARTVLGRVRELALEHDLKRLILCAGPQMLGHLRAVAKAILPTDLAITEVPRELTKLTPSELRAQLAEHDALPKVPPRPSFVSQ